MNGLSMNRRWIMALLIAGIIFGGVILGLNQRSTALAEEATPIVYDPLAIAKIAEKLAPSVVSIETTMKSTAREKSPFNDPNFRRFFGLPDEPQGKEDSRGYGSGFIVDRRGYIITNHHVVQNAETIQVKLLGDKNSYPAQILDSDPDIDIAVLKFDPGKDLSAASFGSSEKMKVGEWVVAIGNPLGMAHTVTVGVISAKGRQIPIADGRRAKVYDDLLQTDAAINPGNSGGPLINLQGQVIGVNSAVSATGQGIGFAQPIDKIRDFVLDVVANGKSTRPWLGVVMIGVNDLDAETRSYFNLDNLKTGVLITEVSPDSPAQAAKLQQYDVILEINKKPVKTAQEMVDAIRALKPGNNISLLIQREGRVMAIRAKLADRPRS